jgi:hypothetical protein
LANSVFFAWQLDTKAEDNRTFIWESIKSACGKLKNESLPELSPRPEKDTEGVSGTPNIVQTIFKKIDACSIFVADITFIAQSESDKYIPNPNVLLELGYAVKSIGWERTILVLNNAYGTANKLPFDMLQHRWPIEYRLTSETKVRDKRKNELEEVLGVALKNCEEYSLNRATEMMLSLDTDTFTLVAVHEHDKLIEMPLPAKTMGQLLTSSSHTASLRRLIDLGAIRVIDTPYIGYGWTSDGLQMIKEINKFHPKMLPICRKEKQSK